MRERGAAARGGQPAPAARRVGRWLGTPALVFVGLISYSLYLWHLPILAFAAYYNIFPLEPRHLVVLLASIFVLAAATWRYVEAPIRGRAVLASDARFLATAGAATLAVASLGVLLWQSADRAERSDAADAEGIEHDGPVAVGRASPARRRTSERSRQRLAVHVWTDLRRESGRVGLGR